MALEQSYGTKIGGRELSMNSVLPIAMVVGSSAAIFQAVPESSVSGQAEWLMNIRRDDGGN